MEKTFSEKYEERKKVEMADIKEVIKGLECCKIPFTKCYDGGCPYFENDGCKARLKGDALALLKAQTQTIEQFEREREQQMWNMSPIGGFHDD